MNQAANAHYQKYFQVLRKEIQAHPDGSWIGSDEHQAEIQKLLTAQVRSAPYLQQLLQKEPNLTMRYEALRLVYLLNLRDQVPFLKRLIERSLFRPLFYRRIHCLLDLWNQSYRGKTSPPADPKMRSIATITLELHKSLWFSMPGSVGRAMREPIKQMAELGESGLYQIDLMLGMILDERRWLDVDSMSFFRWSARTFAQSKYFEGVQVFFDFLADCAPIQPTTAIKQAVGEVLKAIRKLRPYRYPKWATPLRHFVQHYTKIKETGRAAEANMLIILITASTLEQALLLEDDEIVDLLRGRRDAAYTTEELTQVANICDAIIQAGRNDGRIYHIRGWLASRLEGPAAGMSYFHKALDLRGDYVYSHLALSALYEMQGDDNLRDIHLEKACQTEPSLISCQRKFAENLLKDDRFEEAISYYERGTRLRPDVFTELEIEEFFGCFAALASLRLEQGGLEACKKVFERLEQTDLLDRFGARFLERNKVIVELLYKGTLDLKVQMLRHVA